MSSVMKKVALVLGVGPGIGGAVAQKWAKEGFAVACVARNAEKAEKLAQEIGNGSKGFGCDVKEAAQLEKVISQVETEMGDIECMIFNVGSGVFKTYDAVTHAEFQEALSANVLGLFTASQLVCPKMVSRGRGVVGITGATASLRGKPATAAFAATKAAQRSFAQSLARDLGPKGVHVFHVIIDGMVDLPTTRSRMPNRPETDFISSEAIAQTYWDLAAQPKSCWAFEIDVRPSVEQW